MTVVDQYSAILRSKIVPLQCMECGFETSLKRPDELTARSLVAAGSLRELRRELNLLRRADYLFQRFSKSRHPLKASHEHTEANPVLSDDDRAFANELAKDKQLLDHLESSGFLLSARLRFVTQHVTDLATQVHARHRLCNNCGTGILAPEPEFFSQLTY